MNPGSFKNNVTYKLFFYKSNMYNIYMYKHAIALDNQQGLIYRKIQPTHRPFIL